MSIPLFRYGDLVPTTFTSRMLTLPLIMGEYIYFLFVLRLTTAYVENVQLFIDRQRLASSSISSSPSSPSAMSGVSGAEIEMEMVSMDADMNMDREGKETIFNEGGAISIGANMNNTATNTLALTQTESNSKDFGMGIHFPKQSPAMVPRDHDTLSRTSSSSSLSDASLP